MPEHFLGKVLLIGASIFFAFGGIIAISYDMHDHGWAQRAQGMWIIAALFAIGAGVWRK